MLPNSDSEGKGQRGLDTGQPIFYSSGTAVALASIREQQRRRNRTDRVEALVSASSRGRGRENQRGSRENRIEDNDNNNLTIPQVVNRLGKVFFLLFFNLGITIFVFLLTGMMLFSQILFIIFAMFLPISFLLSMIPSYESMAKQAIVRVFNTIMTRAGITLIVTWH